MRHALRLLACLLFAAFAGAAGAQEFPLKPVRVIVGGGTDIVGRVLGKELSAIWRQQVVVEDRPGAGGGIAAEFVAKSAADGYTLLLAAPTLAMTAAWRPNAQDYLNDFAPIVQAGTFLPFIVVVHPSLPVRTIKELIALAKSRPGELNFASPQSGGPTHLSAELFTLMARVKMVHVPYKGVGNSILGIMSGEAQVGFPVAPPALPLVKDGRLRALAVTTPRRSKAAPHLPTVAEAGVPGYETSGWNGLAGPAGIPAHIVSKINSDVLRVLKIPEVQRVLENSGYETADDHAPEVFTRTIRKEIDKWSYLIRESGLKMQ
jgi:tripartite-type tricarboxylate transporter receptor subunit TctC